MKLFRPVALALFIAASLATPASAATLVADYRFDDNLNSSAPVANAPPLDLVGSGHSYATETIKGGPNRVLTFPKGSGLHLAVTGFAAQHPTIGSTYSVVADMKLADISRYRRILRFRDAAAGDSDDGLYADDGWLNWYDGADNRGAVANPYLTANTWMQVALTREPWTGPGDFTGSMVIYWNQNPANNALDPLTPAANLTADGLWFFKDDIAEVEETAGAVSRIRFYAGKLTDAEVAALHAAADPPPSDVDGDGRFDYEDNCPSNSNGDQADIDSDGAGNACDSDDDGDGVADSSDKCPTASDPAQADLDADGQGDACDADDDGDVIADNLDNCPATFNTGQQNLDGDGQGDPCDADDDGDGVADGADKCATAADSNQSDVDGDGQGDACDSDDDGDAVSDLLDNCPQAANADQRNTDGDGAGDACDVDDDGDGVADSADACQLLTRPGGNGCPAAQVLRSGKPRARRAGKRGIRVVTGLSAACPVTPLVCSVAGQVTRPKGRPKSLGRARLTVGPGRTTKVTVKLTKKGAAALRRAGRMRVTITVVATGPDGQAVRVARKARISAPR